MFLLLFRVVSTLNITKAVIMIKLYFDAFRFVNKRTRSKYLKIVNLYVIYKPNII